MGQTDPSIREVCRVLYGAVLAQSAEQLERDYVNCDTNAHL